MSIIDSTVYVIGIDNNFLLEDVYDSLEEAISDIESPYHIACQYVQYDHIVQVYKTSPQELRKFYKEFTLHNITDIKKYLDTHFVQVYSNSFNDYSLEDLAEVLKQSDGHYSNDLNICPIYGVMMSHAVK